MRPLEPFANENRPSQRDATAPRHPSPTLPGKSVAYRPHYRTDAPLQCHVWSIASIARWRASPSRHQPEHRPARPLRLVVVQGVRCRHPHAAAPPGRGHQLTSIELDEH